jgi:hypothetical protein
LNRGFAELARKEFVSNKVDVHELTNESSFSGWTNVVELVEKFWNVRYISKSELEMDFEMLVYNDVFAMYNEIEGEIFGVEIHNEKLAKMQKQIFDFIWGKAEEMKILDKHGTGELK